jgi:pilus assembly protein Flp/PilA
MAQLLRKIVRFYHGDEGPTAVEYAVMLALIVIVCLLAISMIGTNASGVFQKISASVGG